MRPLKGTLGNNCHRDLFKKDPGICGQNPYKIP